SAALRAPGFPVGPSAGPWPFSASPRLIAAVHVLHRLLVPRHPPCALTILTDDRGETPKSSPILGEIQMDFSNMAIALRRLPLPVTLATVQFSRSAKRLRRHTYRSGTDVL